MIHIRLNTGSPDRLYDIQHIPGKGLGFIALHDIPKGTHIMSEEPFIFFPKQRAEQIGWHSAVSHAIQQLPASRRDDFRSLHNQFVNDMLPDLGIFHTNCASVGKPPFALAVYAASSRLNHSCSENSYLVWSSHDQKQTLISTHDIKAGEEITVSYLPEKLPREERRQTLRDACKFDCECNACRDLGELVVSRDATNIHPRLFDLTVEDQKKFIFDGIVSTEQDNVTQVPSTLGDLLRSATVKNHANPKISLPEKPDGIPVSFPFSPKLTPEYTALGLPSSFVPPALEIQVWLWNSDAAPLNNHRYNDFRDNYMFPPFQSLPSEENTDEDHFVLTPTGFRPRRNWVFFCEIVSFDVGSSYEEPDCVNVIVEDKTGHQSRVVFYTDSPAAEAKLAQLEVGYTLGILCPDRCQFSNGTVGTRQQCPRTMRVFRKDLYSMLLLSDKIQRSSPPPVGPSEKRCQICDRSRPFMVECEKCQMFWYCSTLCACIACAEDDHLTECYVMDRPDFQYFIRMNDEFRSWPDFTYA